MAATCCGATRAIGAVAGAIGRTATSAGCVPELPSLPEGISAAGLKRGISASGGGGIGRVVSGASASATCAGVW